MKKGQKRGKREGEVATRLIRACRKRVPSVHFVRPLKLVGDLQREIEKRKLVTIILRARKPKA